MALAQRLLEARGQLQSPDRWVLRHLFGTETTAGPQVSMETALTSSAVFAAVRRIAGDVGATPLKLLRKEGRNRLPAPEHPVDRVLSEAPNPEQTPFEFKEMVTAFYLMGGNGYAEIVRDGAGAVRAVWPIPPDRIGPFRREDKTLVYIVVLPKGGRAILAPEQVLHIRGLTLNGILGLDVIEKMKESIGLTLAMEEFSSRFFRGGSNLSGVLRHPGKLKNPKARDRLQSDWRALHSGLRNMHRVAILEEGMEWVQTSSDPEKTQLLDSRKFGVTEASRYFLIPPHLIGDMEAATYSNVEQQFLEYLSLTLRLHYVRWEEVTKLRLLLPSERAAGYYTKFRTASILMAATKDRYEAHKVGINNGFLSPNDARELEDLNPYEGGDVYVLPINLGPVEGLAAPTESSSGAGELELDDDDSTRSDPIPPPPGARPSWFQTRASSQRSLKARLRLRQVHKPFLEAAAAKWVNREVRQIRRMLAALRGGGSVVELETSLEGFYRNELEPYIARTLLPPLRLFGQSVYREAAGEGGATGDDLETTPRFDTFMKGYAEKVSRAHTSSSTGQLSAIVADGGELGSTSAELADALEVKLVNWDTVRAGRIARQHAVEAEGAVSKLAWGLVGALTATWVALGENCELCDEIDGRSVPIAGSFLKKGDSVDPGGRAPLVARKAIGHPPLHDGCDCGIVIG